MALQFNPQALSRFANVDFGDNDAIANLNGEQEGLVQKGTRGLGILAKFRSGKTQDRNNAVRTELLKALGQAFNLTGAVTDKGGKMTFTDDFMDRLEEVLGPEIFKRTDFGIEDGEVKSGRPLTQRRIVAVCRAAERHFADYGQAFDRTRQSAADVYGHFDHDAVDTAVSQVLSAVITDPDATNLAIGHMRLLIVRSNTTLRSEDDIRKKAEALLANVQELRALAKGDRAVFNAGLAFLAKLEGNALPPGAFRNIFNSVKNLSVLALKNVRPGCGPVRLHKAFRAFVDMTNEVVDGSGAGIAQQLALYRVPLRTFIGHLIMAKCGGKDLQSLHDALHGEDGKTLYHLYQDLAVGAVEYNANDPMDKLRMNIMVAESNQQFSRFDWLVTEAAGIDTANYQGLDFEGEVEYYQDDVDSICGDFLATIAKNPEAYEPD